MLTHYEIFIAVVEQESFINASKVLNLTPSAVSHSISKLEDDFNFKLFIRKKNGIQLTNHAKELYPYIIQLMNYNRNLNQIVTQLNGLERGTISIGTFNSVFINWMPEIFREFSKQYPNIDIKVYQGGYADVVRWIKNGIVDIGFVSLSQSDNLEVTHLYRDPLMCVVPKGFKPLFSDYITIDDIKAKKENIIYQKEGYDAETNKFLKKHNISVHTNFNIENDLSLIAMVESGFGICIVPELVIRNQNFEVDAYPIKPEEYRIIGLASLDKEYITPLALKFYNYIINFLEDKGIKNI